jgi:hypothetical protein
MLPWHWAQQDEMWYPVHSEEGMEQFNLQIIPPCFRLFCKTWLLQEQILKSLALGMVHLWDLMG